MKIIRALGLAVKAHEGQTRKYGNLPYIVHPIQVHDAAEAFLLSIGADEAKQVTMECAAYLHDVLEDCPQISEQEIVDATDENVLKLVKELTNPSKGSTAPRAVRKQMDRDHLQHVSWEAKVIKLIDRTCNLGDLQPLLQLGAERNFAMLYARESRALLECLRGTNKVLEAKLLAAIEKLENG